MCGIFGLIRNTEAPHPERATAAFVELGKHAVERGRDSAGFALTTPTEVTAVTGPTHKHSNSFYTVIDAVTIIKDTLPFHALWNDDEHLPLVAAHRVALGHTRWATQGKRDALTNASPLIVGSLVGTHNGDIDTTTVTGKWGLPARIGTTDTEVLYQALDRDRRDRRKVTDVLRNIEGRAALAWLDRYRPDRVYLSRAALSPLSIAWDAEGNLYWASNPRWFRDIDVQFNGAIGFHDILAVEEGTLLTVSLTDASPNIEDVRRFTPKCRPSDSRLSDGIIWRGFDAEDCAADKSQQRHTVAARRSTYTYGNPYTTKSARKAARKSGGGHGGWDMSAPGYVPSTPAKPSTALPNYNDVLDDLAEQAFSAAHTDDENTSQDAWAEDIDHEAEAMQAAVRWVEEGGDESVLNILRSASMPSEVAGLMEEFELSSPDSFHRFREIVQGWSVSSALN